MIDPKRACLPIIRQCTLLQLNRSGVYYRPVPQSEANLELMRLIDAQFLETPYYGLRQMTWHLRRLGHEVGRKRVRRIMAIMGLRAIYQKPRTTVPHPEHRKYPYLLRDLVINRPDQVWCSDITYIPMHKGFLYLVAVDGLAHAQGAVLASVEHNGCGVLRRGTPGCAGALRLPRDFQHGPGFTIHDAPVHRGSGTTPGSHQHGWARSLAG